MTSLSVFQPYVDKENVDASGARPKARGNSGLGGKIYQSNTPNLVTPRKALRDVNQGQSLSVNGQGIKPQQKPMGLAPQQQLFKKPMLQPPDSLSSNIKSNKSQLDSQKKQKSSVKPRTDKQEKVITKKPDPLPDIENMYIYDEKEDYQPLKEIDFSSVINKLIHWRPPCLFGSRPQTDSDSESEDEQEKIDRIEAAIDMMQPQNIDPFEEEVLEVDFPYIDVEIPSLSDSFDIELGSLELHNSSTPLSLSPAAKLKQLPESCDL